MNTESKERCKYERAQFAFWGISASVQKKSPLLIYFKMAKNKKTKSDACCKKKSVLPFLFIGIIIAILLLVLFISPEEKDTDVPEVITPEIEVISDTIEIAPLNEILVAEETEEIIPEPKIIDEESVIMTLDTPNAIVAPPTTAAEDLVQNFLDNYNNKSFKEACDILVDTKCDATSKGSVSRFGEEFAKMENGYENISVHQVEVPDFHSDIVCVEYDYRYNINANPNPIHEVMSFYVQDGKITYRICEDKTREGKNIGCPIEARRDFCME